MKIVENGKLHKDATQEGWQEKDGFLQLAGKGAIQARQAISGNEFSVNMEISQSEGKGQVLIIIADNAFGIAGKAALEDPFSLFGEEIENLKEKDEILFLQGPSIGRKLFLGAMSDFSRPGERFELKANLKNGILSYSINNKSVYAEKALISPTGRIRINGKDAVDLRVYNINCEGQFKMLASLYSREYLLNRAQSSIDIAAAKLKEDPNRPAFHFLSPANWINDPNGLLFYKGYYHLFYQHNPYADVWEWMHWGHARSKDLVHWEHLPIAVWPSLEKGEEHCFSGSGFIMDDGKPILFYTSIGHENPEQWAMLPQDDELLHWEKHPGNPLLVMDDHNDEMIHEWRDPFLFRESGKTFMVNGGHLRKGSGSMLLYQAKNSELTDWEYLGEAFSGGEKNWECPNFFKIDNQYVLIYSPHGRVEYYTGEFDLSSPRFIPKYHAAIDYGGNAHYYAPNTLQMDNGRRVLFGWIHKFKTEQGWQGAISLPRDLSIDARGRLIQRPVAELTRLRGDGVRQTNINIANSPAVLNIALPQFELIAEVDNEGANNVGILFNDESGTPFEISLSPDRIVFGNEVASLNPGLDEKIRKVHLFFDRTIIELFINDGLVCATWVIYPDHKDLSFQIFSTAENVSLKSLTMWMLKSIW